MDFLQFQKMELEDSRPKCAACRRPMERSYFQLAGHNICTACAEVVRSNQSGPSHRAVLRGFLYGLGAAAGCAIVYAIVTLATGISMALLSIAVGYVVGKAIRKGTGGLGGRRCQVMALLLTYAAISLSWAPVITKGMAEAVNKETPEQKASRERSAAKAGPVAAGLVGMVVVAGLSLAMPFLEVQAGVSGVIGLVIVGLGLMQAWKLTRRDSRLLMGPYEFPAAAPATEGSFG